MIVLKYNRNNHRSVIRACVTALRQGETVAYPTDTSYGLAADAGNIGAVKRLYQIKERDFHKPVHVVVPSIAYAKRLVCWNNRAQKLSGKFLPGPLTLVLPLKTNSRTFIKLSAKSGFLGLRIPKNRIALELVKYFKKPITATSANPSAHLSGGYDSYSAKDIIAQFKNKRYKPDIIIDGGRLPKRKPSTLVKIDGENLEILRRGPISQKQISSALT